MPATKSDVLAAIDRDEPDYKAAAAELGEDALPHLRTLVEEDDQRLAPRAAYLASLIETDESAAVVEQAAGSQHPEVRVAAAAALKNLAAEAGQGLTRGLLDDDDVGVRKSALRFLLVADAPRSRAPSELKERVQQMADSDPEPGLRELAADVARRLQ